MTKDRNAGVPKPMTIPMDIPLLGGKGPEKQMSVPDAVQLLMQQMGNVMAAIESLTTANNTVAMELELQKTRVTALEAKATLLPSKIEVTVKHEQRNPLLAKDEKKLGDKDNW